MSSQERYKQNFQIEYDEFLIKHEIKSIVDLFEPHDNVITITVFHINFQYIKINTLFCHMENPPLILNIS